MEKSAFLKQRGQFCSKFPVQGVVPTNHFNCRKTKMIDYGIKMLAEVFFRIITIHAFDRRTDEDRTA